MFRLCIIALEERGRKVGESPCRPDDERALRRKASLGWRRSDQPLSRNLNSVASHHRIVELAWLEWWVERAAGNRAEQSRTVMARHDTTRTNNVWSVSTMSLEWAFVCLSVCLSVCLFSIHVFCLCCIVTTSDKIGWDPMEWRTVLAQHRIKHLTNNLKILNWN